MTVIDLLIRMARDKDYKPTFKYRFNTYRYDKKTKSYIPSFLGLYKLYAILNEEIEIINEKASKLN